MYVLNQRKRIILKKNNANFLVKKVGSGSESGSGTNIPDPNLTWPKGIKSDRIRIYQTMA
jgi:hypothetical protein